MLFADDAAFVSHTESGPQAILDLFATVCQDFGLTIFIKETEVLAMGTHAEPTILISNQALNSVDTFKYHGSTITSNLSLDSDLNARIGKGASVFGKLQRCVWLSPKLRSKTKIRVYSVCVLSTLLYGSETWPAYTRRWLGRSVGPKRLPKDQPCGQLPQGKRSTGRPLLRYKDVCKRDLKAAKISVDSWESLADHRIKWRAAVKTGCKRAEEERMRIWEEKRQRKKASVNNPSNAITYACSNCLRPCSSRIGPLRHKRKCLRQWSIACKAEGGHICKASIGWSVRKIENRPSVHVLSETIFWSPKFELHKVVYSKLMTQQVAFSASDWSLVSNSFLVEKASFARAILVRMSLGTHPGGRETTSSWHH